VSSNETDLIGRMIENGAEREPDRVAIKMVGGESINYRDLHERSTRLANALLGRGLQQGDRVAAWLDNCPEYIELYLAVAKAGLVMVPVNSLFKLGEAQFQVEDSGARAIVYSARFAGDVEQLATRTALELLIEHAEAGAVSQVEGAVSLVDLRATGGTDRPPPPHPDDLFVIAYTSGTTGRPKGAMLTHRSVKNVCRLHTQSYRTPMFSVAAYQANMSFVATVTALIMLHLHVCGTVVITGKVDVPEFLDIIEEEQCMFVYVPTPWIAPFTELARQHPEKWQQVRVFIHSASKGSPDELRALADVVGKRFFEGWGMSEVSGALATGTTEDDIEFGSRADDLYASVGRPVADVVVRVVDDTGQELPHDGESIGELILQSATLMTGYWNNPAATDDALRAGWYHSGDLGSIDAAGYVYVTERRNDLIVSGGMNVYPTEVEQAISNLVGVAEVAVVGVAHPRWGQTVVAVVAVEPGAVVTEQMVIDYCKDNLATYKKPTSVLFVDKLPRTASDKVLRRVLRDEAALALCPD
jgi:acyl-CoA synthetase (AMP-forming)/AMP-acid ligase II